MKKKTHKISFKQKNSLENDQINSDYHQEENKNRFFCVSLKFSTKIIIKSKNRYLKPPIHLKKSTFQFIFLTIKLISNWFNCFIKDNKVVINYQFKKKNNSSSFCLQERNNKQQICWISFQKQCKSKHFRHKSILKIHLFISFAKKKILIVTLILLLKKHNPDFFKTEKELLIILLLKN